MTVQPSSTASEWERCNAAFHKALALYPDSHLALHYLWNNAVASAGINGVAQAGNGRGDLTKLAAECHRAKWQFDFNDENRLPVGQARDMVKRAFGELHRIGDMALKLRDAAPRPASNAYAEQQRGALIDLIGSAYNTGFNEGMREHTTSRGGLSWSMQSKKYSVMLDKALSLSSTDDGSAA